jgi:hypothetical protein
MRHRGPNGVRLVAVTAARHTLDDVIADLRAFADRLQSEREANGDQQAA